MKKQFLKLLITTLSLSIYGLLLGNTLTPPISKINEVSSLEITIPDNDQDKTIYFLCGDDYPIDVFDE